MPPCRTTAEMRDASMPDSLRHDRERFFRGLALLGVEIGRHIFRQHHRRHRQHVEQPHRAAPGLRQRRRGGDRRLRQIGVGEIDRHQNGLEHLRLLSAELSVTTWSRWPRMHAACATSQSASPTSACSSFGLVNRTSVPRRNATSFQSSIAKSRTQGPLVGRLSSSAFFAAASPLPVSASASSCMPGLWPTTINCLGSRGLGHADDLQQLRRLGAVEFGQEFDLRRRRTWPRPASPAGRSPRSAAPAPRSKPAPGREQAGARPIQPPMAAASLPAAVVEAAVLILPRGRVVFGLGMTQQHQTAHGRNLDSFLA